MGRVKISSPDANVSGGAYLTVINSKIVRGWWTDEQDKLIDKSLLTDVVRFHIETTGFSDEKKITITIMDSDGALNPDDEIYKGEFTIRQNKGFFEFELKRSWLKHIDDDAGDAIELYARCECLSYSVSLPQSSSEYLNVYNVGYIAHNNCRVRIAPNGNIEFCPENMTMIAYNQWKAYSENPDNWTYSKTYPYQKDIGVSREIGYISFGDNKLSDSVPINVEDHNPNANDGVIKTERGAKKDGTADMRQKQRTIATASQSTRVRGATIIAIVNILISAHEYGLIFLQAYENNTFKKHTTLLDKTFIKVAEWYKKNQVPVSCNSFEAFLEVVNIVLFGKPVSNYDQEIFLLAKAIYKNGNEDYKKQ